MPLREEIHRQGEFMFRRRSLLPFFLLPPIAFGMWIDHRLLPESGAHLVWFLGAGFGITLLGLFTRALTVAWVPKRTSGRGTKQAKAATLNTDGVYSVCRHPIYVGNYLCFLGPWAASADWRLIALYSCIFWLYYERIMVYEEEFLRDQFGSAYLRWAERTPAFIPKLSRWRSPTRPFSWRMLFRREATSWFGVMAGFVLVRMMLVVERTGAWRIERFEIVVLSVTGILYLVSRTLRKGTTLLDRVENEGPVSS